MKEKGDFLQAVPGKGILFLLSFLLMSCPRTGFESKSCKFACSFFVAAFKCDPGEQRVSLKWLSFDKGSGHTLSRKFEVSKLDCPLHAVKANLIGAVDISVCQFDKCGDVVSFFVVWCVVILGHCRQIRCFIGRRIQNRDQFPGRVVILLVQEERGSGFSVEAWLV